MRIVAWHTRAREQNLMPAPAPVTCHGQRPVPVPVIRGQGSPAGMPVCPLQVNNNGGQPGASDEEGS